MARDFTLGGYITNRKECVELYDLTDNVFRDRILRKTIDPEVINKDQAIMFYELCRNYTELTTQKIRALTNLLYLNMQDKEIVNKERLTVDNDPVPNLKIIVDLSKKFKTKNYIIIYGLVRGYIHSKDLNNVIAEAEYILENNIW